MIPKTEIEARLAKLQKGLQSMEIDGAIFVYPIDIYYFSGSRQNSALWVPSSGLPTLFVRKSFIRAEKESRIEDVRPFPSGPELRAFFEKNVRLVGMTFDVLPVQLFQYYEKTLKGITFTDISALNRELRSIKSFWELNQMKESSRRLCEMFSLIPSFLKTGMRECDLAAEIEFSLRSKWSDGNLRMRAFNQEITGLAVSGKNAASPGCFDGPVTGRGLSSASPFGPSDEVITRDCPVMIDYPGIFNGYIVDMTRIFVLGSLDAELKKAFDISLDIQNWLVDNIRPGCICEELYNGAVKIAESAGLGDRFMGFTGEQSKFVGHGVGLELDELPVLARRFRNQILAGHTIAIEPKFVFPERGVVGIENTYAVTAAGCEKLTDFPDNIVYL